MTFRTEERDQLHKMIEKYKCSPFTGKCYTEEISFYRDKKTGLYHLIFSEETIRKFKFSEDFLVEGSGGVRGTPHMNMIMIQPTDEDNQFLIFKKRNE